MNSSTSERANQTFPGSSSIRRCEREDNSSRLNRVYGLQTKDAGNPLIREVLLACARNKGID